MAGYSYSPYGQTQSTGNTEGDSVQYTGRENDNNGLYYYRARYYDPVLKRFLSEDPIGLAGGEFVVLCLCRGESGDVYGSGGKATYYRWGNSRWFRCLWGVFSI
ncbi:MAG: RHS repeat-associated core domain-containing protein [Burkholderiales bacterium]